MLSIFHRDQGPYAFYEADLIGDSEVALRGQIDILALIATALRGDVPKDAMVRVIRKLGSDRQRVKKGAPLQRLALQSNEMAFVELMRAEPATAAILIEQFGDPKVAQRMLYLLAITECLEPYARSRNRSSRRSHRLRYAHSERPLPRSAQSMSSSGSMCPSERPGSSPPGARDSMLPGGDSVLPASLSNLPPARTLSGEIVAPRALPGDPPAGLAAEHRSAGERSRGSSA